MSSDDAAETQEDSGTRAKKVGLALIGVLAGVVAAIFLEAYAGIPFDTTYRVVCAGVCLWFIYRLQKDLPEAGWLRIGLGLSALLNVALFFTPVVDRPSSRGELILFAVPDLVVVLAVRIATLRPVDVEQRAKRVQLIACLVMASAACVGLLWVAVAESRGLH
jgi:hypothetical protein